MTDHSQEIISQLEAGQAKLSAAITLIKKEMLGEEPIVNGSGPGPGGIAFKPRHDASGYADSPPKRHKRKAIIHAE